MQLLSGLCVTLFAGCAVYDVGLAGGEIDAGTPGAVAATGAGGGGSAGAGGGAGRQAAGVGGGGTGGVTASSGGQGGASGGLGGMGGAGGSTPMDGGGLDEDAVTPTSDGSIDGGLDSSRGPRHAFLETGGLVSIEAEHFVASAPGTGRAVGIAWQNATAQVDTSGSYEQALPKIGVNTGDTFEGPELEYDLRFTNSGTYYAWVRLVAGNSQSDSVHLAWDERVPLTYGGQGIGANSTTWVWKNGVSGFIAADGGFVPVKVDVTAGYHTLRVYMREDGVAVDKIVMTKDSAAPTGTGPVESPRE